MEKIQKVAFVLPQKTEEAEPADLFLAFYRNLGWHSNTQILNPKRVKISKANYKALYEWCCEDANESFSAMFINFAPSVSETLEDGTVLLLDGAIKEEE